MFSYGQYCPLAKAAEVLGDRWTMLIVRELLHGTERFNELHRYLPGISRSVLSDRLRRLEDTGILHREVGDRPNSTRYSLTSMGEALRRPLLALGEWGAHWILEDPRPGESDPDLVMIFLARRVDTSQLPPERVVVEFILQEGRARRRYWLVFDGDDSSLCLQHPGFEPDLHLRCKVTTLQRIYMGRTAWGEALRAGELEVEGPRRWARAFPGWMKWSPVHAAVRESALRKKRAARG